MNLFKISRIIAESMFQKLSDSKLKEQSNWADKSKLNREFIEQLNNEGLDIDEFETLCRFDEDKAWQKFEHSVKARRKKEFLIQVSKIAAIVVLTSMLGVFGYVMLRRDGIFPSYSKRSLVQPGDFRAKLHIDNNEVIAISDSVTTSLKNNESILAEIDKGQLVYETSTELKPTQMTIEVPEKSEFHFKLSDGSKVWMNAGSKVSFQHPFTGDIRNIKVEGEVYFEVTKDVNHPFVVDLPYDNSIRVLGTKFNVNVYPEEYVFETVLLEGSVLWHTYEGKERLMEPGELLQFNRDDAGIEVTKVDVTQYAAWKDGRFVFDGDNLESIMTELSRWYGVSVSYDVESIKDLHFSADVERYENMSKILNLLELTGKISFEIKDNRIIVKKQN